MLRFSLPERDQGLFSEHYVRDVLPNQSGFTAFDPGDRVEQLIALLGRVDIARLKEQAIEHAFLADVFRLLGLSFRSQPTIQGKEIDFAFHSGDEFREDFGNTVGICELKKRGRIENRYTIRKDDNSDPIAQIRFYLKEVNARLQADGSGHTVDFGVLTDGIVWRLYARFHTQGNDEFAAHFFEMRLDEILACPDEEKRRHHFKLFFYLFGNEGWSRHLGEVYREARTLAEAVSTGLRDQVFTALELIATGLWRRVTDPLEAGHYQRLFRDGYALDVTDLDDATVRRAALRIVYDESIVFLLRLLFLLFGEDRGLLPRLLKAPDGLVERVVRCRAPIGLLTAEHAEVMQDFDVRIAGHCREIDRRYNGGIFSDEKHPLLRDFNIDNVLFANAIDHLCRVPLGKDSVVVDFGSISVREMGTLYEGLLSYKLAEADRDELAVNSLVDRHKHRFHLRRGDLYLVNEAGERKASGSYYTPDLIVSYLVDRTLGKRLAGILEGGGDAAGKIAAIHRVRVCDPAMGSGHFLVEAFDRLVQAVRSVQEADEVLAAEEVQSALLVRRCLFGVDLNPMAVEIAKMVLWLRTFRPDRPLEFFDANLKCGNSLVGSVRLAGGKVSAQRDLFAATEDWEREIVGELTGEVQAVIDLPSTTIEEIRAKEGRYQEKVLPLLKDATFIEHARLLQHFFPERWGELRPAYDAVVKRLAADRHFLRSLFAAGKMPSLFPDEGERAAVANLLELVVRVGKRFRPIHWPLEFPHVFQDGGFDVIVGNPPWDIVTTDFRVFFSDYIPGFADLETKDAKAAGEALCAANPAVAAAFAEYTQAVEELNGYVAGAYRYQVATDEQGRRLKKGDNNLYKLFIEQAWRILAPDGACGFVVPSGLNSDSGCTGLRQLLLKGTTLEEVVMFENRRGVFPDVHRQYKFDALTFRNHPPHKNHRFQAGFYWLDPIWLAGQGKGEDRDGHERFTYPIHLSEVLAPDTLSLIEMRSARDIPVLDKLARFPLLGDESQAWHAETYAEFHMTSDSDLFRTDGIGYPLFEGKCVHQFDARFAAPTRSVVSSEGEERLSQRWKCSAEELPNRLCRIGFRSIAAATNQRTLIATLLPPHVFCGNSLNLLELRELSLLEATGVLALLNSLVLDYLLRFRVSTNVNAFYVKQLPVPRDRAGLALLGDLAAPLLAGPDFADARGGRPALENPAARRQRRAELDARVARLYGLTYEELQHVTRQFSLVAKEDPGYLEEVLRQFRALA